MVPDAAPALQKFLEPAKLSRSEAGLPAWQASLDSKWSKPLSYVIPQARLIKEVFVKGDDCSVQWLLGFLLDAPVRKSVDPTQHLTVVVAVALPHHRQKIEEELIDRVIRRVEITTQFGKPLQGFPTPCCHAHT